MTYSMYQVDAFADDRFSGNPAAVVPLEKWLDDQLMQNIALENNLSETAFFVPNKDGFAIRWFTPSIEVKLCGHATLAAAHVIYDHLNYKKEEVTFESKSGQLTVKKAADKYTLIFPSDQLKQVTTPVEILKAFKINPLETYKGRDDYMVVVESQRMVKSLDPDFKTLALLQDCRGVIVTAKGNEVDFISRCFYPQSGVDEDPATGSAHTTMTPYWAKKLQKKNLSAVQLSKRKGVFECTDLGDKIAITGKAKTFLEGTINLD